MEEDHRILLTHYCDPLIPAEQVNGVTIDLTWEDEYNEIFKDDDKCR